jgi:geranylgeranyl transferase type-2 subunit beta
MRYAGAFGAHPEHDAHILATLSAIQILTIHDALDRVDVPRVVNCVWHFTSPHTTVEREAVISSLQTPSGVFAGDQFGETDNRFTYCAINALSLLDRKFITPGTAPFNIDNAVSYIRRCRNFDGGFGSRIGGESHAAQGVTFRMASWSRLRSVCSVCLCCCIKYSGSNG